MYKQAWRYVCVKFETVNTSNGADHFTVRTWTAEAYNTLLSCPRFKPVRQRQAKEMAVQLSDILGIFSQGGESSQLLPRPHRPCFVCRHQIIRKIANLNQPLLSGHKFLSYQCWLRTPSNAQ